MTPPGPPARPHGADEPSVDRAAPRAPAHSTRPTMPAVPNARRRDRSPRPLALNLTPMIDVTFLLLVYFMVATQFKLGEEVYRLDLPERRPSTQPRDPFELDEEPLRIRVATVTPARYQLRIEGPYEQPQTFEQLHAFLRDRRVSEQALGGIFAEDHPIIVESLDTTSWEHTLEAFNAAARARYTNVTLGSAGGGG